MHIAQGMKCYHLHCARDLWYVNYADNLEIVYYNITMKSCYSYGGNWTPLQRQGLTMIHNHVPVGCLCMATNDRPVYANDEKSLNPESGAQTNLPIWPLISGISTTQSHSIVDKWLGNTRIHSKSHWLYYSIRLWSCIAYHFLSKTEWKNEQFPLLLKLLTRWKVEANDGDKQCMVAVLSPNCPWNGAATYLHQENNFFFKEYLLVAAFASFAKIPQEGTGPLLL